MRATECRMSLTSRESEARDLKGREPQGRERRLTLLQTELPKFQAEIDFPHVNSVSADEVVVAQAPFLH
jgi:hypothetical protein